MIRKTMVKSNLRPFSAFTPSRRTPAICKVCSLPAREKIGAAMRLWMRLPASWSDAALATPAP